MVARRTFLSSVSIPFLRSLIPDFSFRSGSSVKAVGTTRDLFRERAIELNESSGLHVIRDYLSPGQARKLDQKLYELAEDTNIPLDQALNCIKTFAKKLITQATTGTNFQNLRKFLERIFKQSQEVNSDELYFSRLNQIIESSKNLRELINQDDWTMTLETELSDFISLLANDIAIKIPEISNLNIKEFLLLKKQALEAKGKSLVVTECGANAPSNPDSGRLALATNLSEEAV